MVRDSGVKVDAGRGRGRGRARVEMKARVGVFMSECIRVGRRAYPKVGRMA